MKKFVIFLLTFVSLFFLAEAVAFGQSKARQQADHGGGMDKGSFSFVHVSAYELEALFSIEYTGNPLDYVYIITTSQRYKFAGKMYPIAEKWVGFIFPAQSHQCVLRPAIYLGDFAVYDSSNYGYGNEFSGDFKMRH